VRTALVASSIWGATAVTAAGLAYLATRAVFGIRAAFAPASAPKE
jgi:hypothetical protein